MLRFFTNCFTSNHLRRNLLEIMVQNRIHYPDYTDFSIQPAINQRHTEMTIRSKRLGKLTVINLIRRTQISGDAGRSHRASQRRSPIFICTYIFDEAINQCAGAHFASRDIGSLPLKYEKQFRFS